MSSAAKSFVRTDIKVPSKTPGWDLDAWKYLPKSVVDQKKQVPVIIMAHGISSNKLMGLADYAEAFAALGYGVVVFDYRRWGASAGLPRHVLYISEQLDDYRTVVKYCRQQPEFDSQRVVLWGTSFAGGHVVSLASEKNLNISAVVAQCPYLGNTPTPRISWAFVKTILKAIQDVLKQAIGLNPVYMPAAAEPGEVGLMTAPGSLQGINEIVKQAGTYPNEINASALFDFPVYSPGRASGSRITCPVRIIAPEQDNLCPYSEVTALARASANVDVVSLPCGHFKLYPGCGEMYEKSLAAMKEFLVQHVPL